jgi:hypothetical protein
MRKASTSLLEQGTQTPSPAPDLIPAQTKNQPRTHTGIGTANGGTSLDRAEAEAARRSGVVGIGVGLHPGYNAAQRLYVSVATSQMLAALLTENALWKRAHPWCLTMTS